MNNNFDIHTSKENIKELIRNSIEVSENAIEHYDYILNDISGIISDAELEATKLPSIEFLKQMRKCWYDFKYDLEMKLKILDQDNT